MSFVFLTESHAYKLKKPIRTALLDHTTVEARRAACETELALNRRLAPDVYLAVVPVASLAGELRVEQAGAAVEWLVKMRRLPRDRMLDACIARGTAGEADIDGLAAVLTRFYAGAARAPATGSGYRARIASDIAAKRNSLAQPRYGLSRAELRAAVDGQARWLERHGDVLEARAARLVDAHGDLRPEHVCLQEPAPVVIDCLEFSRALRLLDPISELSFLALECRRLDAAWIGDRLLAHYADRSGDRAPAALIPFYQSYHALVRAAIAVWHLDDDGLGDGAAGDSARWHERGSWYLRTARALL